MKKLIDLFDIQYGNQFDFSKMEISNSFQDINFICRSSHNNGFMAKVKKYKNIEPFERGLITVTMGGSYLLSSFVQPQPFYTAQNIKILKPKQKMTLQEKLFYCCAIEHNRFRYHSHSREANSTFDKLLVPDFNELPNYLSSYSLMSPFPSKPIQENKLRLETKIWKYINLSDYFYMQPGKYYPSDTYENGNIPLISASTSQNGVMKYTNISPSFNGNQITIGKVSMSIFYQALPFVASSDVTVLTPKFKMNKYVGFFLQGLLSKEEYRWNYGRQIRLGDCMKIKVKLPIMKDGKPDWQFMEDFIKSLPYSKNL